MSKLSIAILCFLISALIVIIAYPLLAQAQTVVYIAPQSPELPHNQSLVIPHELQRIGHCESPTGQFNPDGTLVRGKINSHDIGEFQINETYHLAEAEKMGLDIYTKVGNEQFALYLYKTQGTNPWLASEACWNK